MSTKVWGNADLWWNFQVIFIHAQNLVQLITSTAEFNSEGPIISQQPHIESQMVCLLSRGQSGCQKSYTVPQYPYDWFLLYVTFSNLVCPLQLADFVMYKGMLYKPWPRPSASVLSTSHGCTCGNLLKFMADTPLTSDGHKFQWLVLASIQVPSSRSSTQGRAEKLQVRSPASCTGEEVTVYIDIEQSYTFTCKDIRQVHQGWWQW